MSWSNPNAPNLPDFLLFIQNSMQIPASALPADSPWPGYAFNQAMALTLFIPVVPAISYTLAVYNCGGHILLRITPDQPGMGYFQDQRTAFDLLSASSGVIASSSDQATSNSFATPESLKNLTVGDLGFFRTPWGRELLAYQQSLGQVCGLS